MTWWIRQASNNIYKLLIIWWVQYQPQIDVIFRSSPNTVLMFSVGNKLSIWGERHPQDTSHHYGNLVLSTPKEILNFPRQGLGWKALRDEWSSMAFCNSHKCCIESGRLPWTASLTALGEMGELKNRMVEQPVNTKGCSSFQFFQRNFYLKVLTFLCKITIKCGLRKKKSYVIQ